MTKTRENTAKLLDFVGRKFQAGQLDNESLVQLIELSGNYLNISTIPQYAQNYGKSYNGVKKCRNVIKLFNVKFVIDNT